MSFRARLSGFNLSLRWLRDPYGVSALAIYALLSWFFLGRSVAGDLSARYIGTSNDPSVYMWCLSWWPYAIGHGHNPIITNLVWAPEGFNLAWTTPMPLPALLAAPITGLLGPVVTYNVLCILAPALAAWAGFLLCRQIVADSWAAGAGGYVFGFSAYTLAEIRAHLPLVLIFPLPLALLLVLAALEGRISRSWLGILLGAVLMTAFLCWAELYATMSFFGTIALGLALFWAESSMRSRIRELLLPILTAYTFSLIAVLPYLYYFFRPGYPRSPINSPRANSADLLNLLLPTAVDAIGNIGIIQKLAGHFIRNSLEAGAYFGLPLIAIAAWLTWERWHEPMTRALITFLVIVCVLMLGPRLHVNGIELFGLPWKIMLHLPMLRYALPARFSVYAFLALAMIASSWLGTPRPAATKIAVMLLLAIFLCPNLSSIFWSRKNDTPPFFTGDDYHQYLKPGENVIILPYGINGTSMLWQAAANFYFRMAGGWTSVTPLEFQRWPIVSAMLTRTYIPDITRQLRVFMASHGSSTIIVNERDSAFWEAMLSPLDNSPVRSGGVEIYQAPPDEMKTYKSISALEMERRSAVARFSALLVAARTYLAQKRDLAALTPLQAQRLGLLPPNWVNDPDKRTSNGLYLGPWKGNEVAVGVAGSYPALQPVIEKYRSAAAEIFLPFPRRLVDSWRGDTFRLLVMVFDQKRLAQAARAIESPR